jgi:hypothetical protein
VRNAVKRCPSTSVNRSCAPGCGRSRRTITRDPVGHFDRSRHSSWRTSPTISRCGRIRSASLTNRRSGISPVPSRFACRVCMATTSGNPTCSSKTSSTVTTRSRAGTVAHNALSSVVLPAWVPPETSTFSPAVTHASKNRAACSVIVPTPTSSSSECNPNTNLRMLTASQKPCGAPATMGSTNRRLSCAISGPRRGQPRAVTHPGRRSELRSPPSPPDGRRSRPVQLQGRHSPSEPRNYLLGDVTDRAVVLDGDH